MLKKEEEEPHKSGPKDEKKLSLTPRRRQTFDLHRDWRALTGIISLGIFVILAFCAQWIAPYDPNATTFEPDQPPSWKHLLGTTSLQEDVLSQLIYGTQTILIIGFSAGILSTCLATIIGALSGYHGGGIDHILNTITNVFLVIPGLPLIIVLAGYLHEPHIWAIIFILTLTTWSYGARIIRSKSLIISGQDFILAARISGEKKSFIIFVELLPNLLSIIFTVFITTVLATILTSSAIEFLGLAHFDRPSWGKMLYWANTRSAVALGSWWWFLPPGICLASISLCLIFINLSSDKVFNRSLDNERRN